MDKCYKQLLLFTFCFIVVAAGSQAFAQNNLEVTYPTIPRTGRPVSVTTPLSIYFKYIYNFSIIAAGFLTFILLVWGGVIYLFSSGKPTLMAKAKSQITNALLGMVIILSSYLILNTLNPRLLLFNLQLPDISLSPITVPTSPSLPLPQFQEIPVGTLITSEIGASSFIATSTPDTDCNCKEYNKAFSQIASYPTDYQGGLHGRRLKRINEVASTTLPALEMLKELSGEFVELMNEFGDYNEELYQKVLECTCDHCDKPTCSGNGSCDCASCNTCIEPSPDVCPDRDRMEELRNEILPSYYEKPTKETSPIYCEIYLMKYMAEHFRRFLDSSIERPLIKNDDYKEQSYWWSKEAEELRTKIRACIAASNSWEGWIQSPPRGDDLQTLFDKIENVIWKNATTSLASVENKGTYTPKTNPPQRDVQTNIEHLKGILILLENGVKPALIPESPGGCMPQAYTFTQKYQISDILDTEIEIVPLGDVRVISDPATFYCALGPFDDPRETFLLEDVSLETICADMIEIPIGKTIDEAIQLIRDILRELENIYEKGHKVIDDILQQGELATTTTEELVPEFIDLTGMEECECSRNCEPTCNCICVPVCVAPGVCTTHCICECLCLGNACPFEEITSVFNQIQSNIKQINDLFEEIKKLIGTPEDVIEENEIVNKDKTSIYESYFKLNSEYPEWHPDAGERAPIGQDICCTNPEGYCRDPNSGDLIFGPGQAEKRNYTLKEKLAEVQKLLNRSRDFRTYVALIEELIKFGFAKQEEIDNIPVDSRLDLSNCDVLIAQLAQQVEGGEQNAPVNCWLAGPSNYGYLRPERCSVDPPFDCDFFDETKPEKRSSLLCYCFQEVLYPDSADDFFCCKGIQ